MDKQSLGDIFEWVVLYAGWRLLFISIGILTGWIIWG